MSEFEGAFNIRRELSAYWLELLINQASKSVQEAAADRDDGSSGPGSFVDFCFQIKIGKRVIDLEGALKVDTIMVFESAPMVIEEVREEAGNSADTRVGFSSGKLLVRSRVGEVVNMCSSNIFGTFEDNIERYRMFFLINKLSRMSRYSTKGSSYGKIQNMEKYIR